MVVTIQLSNAADGKINVPTRITAKITSTVGIKNIEWLSNPSTVNFTITTDQRTYTFTPSEYGEYTFTVTVWENDGQRASALSRVTVAPPVQPAPTPQPAPNPNPAPIPSPEPGTVLWDTRAWLNGIERHLKGHHEFDPYDKLFEVAAGENRDWFINGKGHCFASGARTRGYNHTKQAKNVKYCWETSYIPNSTLSNFSGQFFSRHNEGDPETNRYGGCTIAFHLDSIEFAEEHWHNDRNGNDSKSLSVKLQNGQVVKLKIIGIQIPTSTSVKTVFDIFVNNKLEWHKEHTTPNQYAEAVKKEALYWRWRVNGSAPKNVDTFDWRISRV